MKKILCVFVVLPMLLAIAGCGKKQENTTTTQTTAPQSTTRAVTIEQYESKVKANGYSPALLPKGFLPALPENLTVVYTAQYEPNNEYNYYKRGFTRLRVSVSAANLTVLNGFMNQSGWTGKANFYSATKEDGTAKNWIEGFWKQEGYAAFVADCDEKAGEFVLSVDIFEYTFTFPKQIAAIFPAFDGVSLMPEAVYAAKNGKYTLTSPQELAGKSWRWEFTKNGVFFGVTEKEAQAYSKALTEAGFSVSVDTDEQNDFGEYVTFTAEKTLHNKTVFAQFIYEEYAQTLMAVYTNDYDSVKE